MSDFLQHEPEAPPRTDMWETASNEGVSLVGRYFLEASDFTVMSAAQEQRLGRRLVRSLAALARAQALSDDIPLTIRDVAEALAEHELSSLRLRRHLRLVRACQHQLINRNLRLAVHIARQHGNRGLPLTDLIQEGNIGLMKAVERFDPQKGFRFSTYAYWWISEEIKRSLRRNGRVVRTPDHVVDEIRELNSITMGLYRTLGRRPTRQEIAKAMAISPERVIELRSYALTEVSADMPLNDEGGLTLVDALSDDEHLPPPDQPLVARDQNRLLAEILSHLNGREREVLSRRFGLDRPEPDTLQVISDDLGISRERVRQIEKSALRKLRKQFATMGDMAGN
ncbi:MAG: RNA polymerase sigma factor RpoD/SigA [Marinobacter sp.]|nr:RNA polymerase sigma factor RpoD/SigA [Marinobacter sp.]